MIRRIKIKSGQKAECEKASKQKNPKGFAPEKMKILQEKELKKR